MSKQKTAAILAIGDELLSGRTRDANMHYLAGWLTERGGALLEARVVPDDADAIGGALNALRAKYDYVFTSGGIGPTHDDITVDAIAAALGVKVIEHPRAAAMVRAYYGERGIEVTPARLRMARTPEGAELIDNPVSGAPGMRHQIFANPANRQYLRDGGRAADFSGHAERRRKPDRARGGDACFRRHCV